MIMNFISIFSLKYPATVVYMLQSCEYRVFPYLKWYWQTNNFYKVAKRRNLKMTKAAKALLLVIYAGIMAQIIAGLVMIYLWFNHGNTGYWEFGLALILLAPVLWAHLILLPLLLGRIFIVYPRTKVLVGQSEKVFKNHPGLRVAVTGSYGKTSMKELLTTVLSTSKKVATTPGNKNVPISHAIFAKKLKGDEDILIIEYGEGAPGDVDRFARVTHPTHAVITGLAPAHLDQYKTLQAAGNDIFSVANYIKQDKVYVNGQSKSLEPFLKKKFEIYNDKGALGWKVTKVKNSINGIRFNLTKGSKKIEVKSELVGEHHIGPLAFAAAFADQLGLNKKDIESGLSQTRPFEHRMQPYKLGGAWIIDDTYNGNIEGIRVGCRLLSELKADRKIYVTPGLVDQGYESDKIHEEMGRLITSAKPNIVVLMNNSVTKYIEKGLKNSGYTGQVLVEDDPLKFYLNLKLFVANGDLVLMQNDWPDNYS